jgi:2-keto-4-pentenoate hydratase/2-oxohepta-3-ene-1,7-dioic acid hydratase in catechol pathway
MTYALATVEHQGRSLACLLVQGRYFPLQSLDAALPSSLSAIYEAWPAHAGSIADLAERCTSGGLAPADVRVEAPLQYPGKILCAGANYFDHLAEMGMPDAKKEDQRLFFFMKPPRNAVVGPGATVHMPIGTQAFDWEIELAAVIGKTARNETFYKLDWVAGKGHDTCCPLGPQLVPASAIADPQKLGLKLWVNGQLKQDGHSSQMIFSLAEQIATASRIMTLDPGDVLLTGTPAGVGAPKKTFLSVGDQVDAEIEGIGRLSVTIQASR